MKPLTAFLLLILTLAHLHDASAQTPLAGENGAIRVELSQVLTVPTKLGEAAATGEQWLVLRGKLINRNPTTGTSVPPVDKAFPLKVNHTDTLALNPLSEDSASPIWGPLTLYPGEVYPFEMIFSIPAEGVNTLELFHHSTHGKISLYLKGQPLEDAKPLTASQPERTPSPPLQAEVVAPTLTPGSDPLPTPSRKTVAGVSRLTLPNGAILYVGHVPDAATLKTVKDAEPEASFVVDIVPQPGSQHPTVVKQHATRAFAAAGFSQVKLKMRRKDELIVMGTVDSEESEALAISIADAMPGITRVVNGLKY